jgi:hypothetical protein
VLHHKILLKTCAQDAYILIKIDKDKTT